MSRKAGNSLERVLAVLEVFTEDRLEWTPEELMAALGYSVVNATTVFPGIRYTGRVAGDALGTMPQGEGTVINGTGVQTTTNSRWGDYTSMNVDPVDDCTFWYVNEYYTAAGQASSPAGWQTRIASFRLPGC